LVATWRRVANTSRDWIGVVRLADGRRFARIIRERAQPPTLNELRGAVHRPAEWRQWVQVPDAAPGANAVRR